MLEEPPGTVEFQPSPFFAEQLRAFELWLEHGSQKKRPPEQLPIVLQASVDTRCVAHLLHESRVVVQVDKAVFLQLWLPSCMN